MERQQRVSGPRLSIRQGRARARLSEPSCATRIEGPRVLSRRQSGGESNVEFRDLLLPVSLRNRSILTCRTTMKNKIPHAIGTFKRNKTITTPPTCPSKLTSTKTVARNLPHDQLISIYSLCSFHCTHILSPSSKKVAIRHKRAIVGRTLLPLRWTYNERIIA